MRVKAQLNFFHTFHLKDTREDVGFCVSSVCAFSVETARGAEDFPGPSNIKTKE
jgi:hypothetical protein